MERELPEQALLSRAQIIKVGIAQLEESIENEAAVLLDKDFPNDPLALVTKIREANRPRVAERTQLEEEFDNLASLFTQQVPEGSSPDQVREKYERYQVAWQGIREGVKEGTIPQNYLEDPAVSRFKVQAERSELALELFNRGSARISEPVEEPTEDTEQKPIRVIKLKKDQDGNWQSQIDGEPLRFTPQDCEIMSLFAGRQEGIQISEASGLVHDINPKFKRAELAFRKLNEKLARRGYDDHIKISYSEKIPRVTSRWVLKGATVEIEEDTGVGGKNREPNAESQISPAYSS